MKFVRQRVHCHLALPAVAISVCEVCVCGVCIGYHYENTNIPYLERNAVKICWCCCERVSEARPASLHASADRLTWTKKNSSDIARPKKLETHSTTIFRWTKFRSDSFFFRSPVFIEPIAGSSHISSTVLQDFSRQTMILKQLLPAFQSQNTSVIQCFCKDAYWSCGWETHKSALVCHFGPRENGKYFLKM